MAIPLYDALSVSLSKKIGDPVAAASTNGKVWTSALRDTILNQAIRRWIRKMAEVKNWNALKSYITEDNDPLVANLVAFSAFSGTIAWIVGDTIYNGTADKLVYRLPEEYRNLARSGLHSYFNPSTRRQFFVEDAGSIRVLGSGATDSITVRYVKEHTDLAANTGSTDLAIGTEYHDQIVDLAFQIAMEEKATAPARELAALKAGVVEKEIAESAVLRNA